MKPEKKEILKGMNNRMKAVYANKTIDAFTKHIEEVLGSEEVKNFIEMRIHSFHSVPDIVNEILEHLRKVLL